MQIVIFKKDWPYLGALRTPSGPNPNKYYATTPAGPTLTYCTTTVDPNPNQYYPFGSQP